MRRVPILDSNALGDFADAVIDCLADAVGNLVQEVGDGVVGFGAVFFEEGFSNRGDVELEVDQ